MLVLKEKDIFNIQDKQIGQMSKYRIIVDLKKLTKDTVKKENKLAKLFKEDRDTIESSPIMQINNEDYLYDKYGVSNLNQSEITEFIKTLNIYKYKDVMTVVNTFIHSDSSGKGDFKFEELYSEYKDPLYLLQDICGLKNMSEVFSELFRCTEAELLSGLLNF